MSSSVDICNLALGHLGDDATVSSIDPPEGSAQAEHCARFYPMARDSLLEMHTWRFATKRAALAELSSDPPDTWAYAYALPAGCIKPVAVLAPNSVLDVTPFIGIETSTLPSTPLPDYATQDFIVEAMEDGTLALYTNVETANLVYIARVTDTTKFTPLFVDALARLLASRLAGPVIKGETGMKVSMGQLKWFTEVDYPNATKANANASQAHAYTHAIPDAIAARQ